MPVNRDHIGGEKESSGSEFRKQCCSPLLLRASGRSQEPLTYSKALTERNINVVVEEMLTANFTSDSIQYFTLTFKTRRAIIGTMSF